MTALPTQSSASNMRWTLLFPLISLVVIGLWYLTPLKGMVTPVSTRAAVPPTAPAGKAGSIYTNVIRPTLLQQQPIDRVPDGPLMLRVTELEMEPGSRIFEHRQLGPGTHILLSGAITVTDSASGQAQIHTAGSAYYEGMEPLHDAVNNGSQPNHILMVELLPQSRGFDGNQQFTDRGKHNEGEIRSGPYVQVPLTNLPEGPLMFRVSALDFGPKAKSVEHTRVGPAVFYVTQGGATVRKESMLQITTYGTNGYFFEPGPDPLILENKPASPMRLLMAEVLPQSLGDGPSTLITGS